jgi:uncharacterized protein YjiS (DUF1127 family)
VLLAASASPLWAQNLPPIKAGGLLNRKLAPVVVDPASNWPLFAEKMRELLQVHKVDVVFGNWMSVSRKSVLPLAEERHDLRRLDEAAIADLGIGRKFLKPTVIESLSLRDNLSLAARGAIVLSGPTATLDPAQVRRHLTV